MPFLFLIDKFVKNFWPNYIFAGGVLSLGAWFVLSWPAFSLRLLSNPSDWYWRGALIFSLVGLATGTLFTLALHFLPVIGEDDRFDQSLGAKK